MKLKYRFVPLEQYTPSKEHIIASHNGSLIPSSYKKVVSRTKINSFEYLLRSVNGRTCKRWRKHFEVSSSNALVSSNATTAAMFGSSMKLNKLVDLNKKNNALFRASFEQFTMTWKNGGKLCRRIWINEYEVAVSQYSLRLLATAELNITYERGRKNQSLTEKSFFHRNQIDCLWKRCADISTKYIFTKRYFSTIAEWFKSKSFVCQS